MAVTFLASFPLIPAFYKPSIEDIIYGRARVMRTFFSAVWGHRHRYGLRHVLGEDFSGFSTGSPAYLRGQAVHANLDNLVARSPRPGTKDFYVYILVEEEFLPQPSLLRDLCYSTFYIGKGLNDRSHDHFGGAKKIYGQEQPFWSGRKIGAIHRAWREGNRVGYLRFCNNDYNDVSIAIEASLIEFFTLSELSNNKHGDWRTVRKHVNLTSQQKKDLAIFAICKAFGSINGIKWEQSPRSVDIKI